MDKDIQKVQQDAEAVQLFAELEKLSKAKPEVFAFFISKYAGLINDNYDWGYALWHTDDPKAGSLDKFLPYINAAILLFVAAFLFIKVK